jgi:hypothetical protein
MCPCPSAEIVFKSVNESRACELEYGPGAKSIEELREMLRKETQIRMV